jgi:penicillin amidase
MLRPHHITSALLALLLVALCWVLGTRHIIGGKPVPPLGHFFSPEEGFWCNAVPIAQERPADLLLRGLSAPVQVVWDAAGVPHLFAQNDTDLYRAQGYIMATQRLWQMDFVARAAAGRVSEVVGSAALDFDRGQRRKGMLIGAQASHAALMADTLMAPLLNAYADGVNQYIASLDQATLPLEYKLLDHAPEPWSPLRSALVQQYMVENLSGWDRDVEDTHARARLGAALHELLYPVRPPGVVPTVHPDSSWNFTAVPVRAPQAYDPVQVLQHDAHRSDPGNGSNNWAVHGSRTASGHALLANDTHLGLNFPPIWFPVQLSTPDHRVFGFTIPGACGVIIGHNEHAAFGVTNAPRDTRDWYQITWQDARRLAYRDGDTWRPATIQVERIAVRDAADVIDSVRITHHGPVMYDEHFGDVPARAQLALRWMGHEPSLTQKALYLNNRVKSRADHVEALRYFNAPAQNWVFASTQGDISMRIQGTFPNKWPDQGRFILNGADPEHAWQGFIPFEHTATQVNPARGFVSSANQHSVDESYPYWFHNAHLEYYRNRTINNALAEEHRWTVTDMQRLQHSGYDLRAREALAVLLPLVDTTQLDAAGRTVHQLLRSWDHQVQHAGEEAALFQQWYDSLRAELWSPLQQPPLSLGEPTPYTTNRIMGDSVLRAQVEAALGLDMRSVVNATFAALVEDRAARGVRIWKEVNNARVMHLARIPAFSRESLPVNGCGTAVNAQRGNHGPSQRFVVELSDPPQAWYQLPGGVSGNPGDPHYDDLLQEWLTMTYRPVLFLATAEARPSGTQLTVLQP